MAFPDKAGKSHNSKFRAKRADKEAGGDAESKSKVAMGGPEKPEGPRAQANKIEGKDQMSSAPPMGGEEVGAPPDAMGGEPAPMGADHSRIDAIVAAHGPATETHTFHDPASGQSHVESVHSDGYVHKQEHANPGDAHEHAKRAAGIAAEASALAQDEESEGEGDGEDPKKKKLEPAGGDDDDYEAEPL